MAASAVGARSPAASSRRGEQVSSARAGLKTSKATAPQRDAVERAEAVQPAPEAPPDGSPDVDERARAVAAREAACASLRSRADAGKRKREWASVLEATRKRGCWSSAELRVARARLRVTAFAELGELERCAAEGSKSRDREIAARSALCRNKLAPPDADVGVDADVAPDGADVAVDADVAPVGADVAADG